MHLRTSMLKAVHDKVSTFEINLSKKSLPSPAYSLTGSLSDMRPVKVLVYSRVDVGGGSHLRRKRGTRSLSSLKQRPADCRVSSVTGKTRLLIVCAPLAQDGGRALVFATLFPHHYNVCFWYVTRAFRHLPMNGYISLVLPFTLFSHLPHQPRIRPAHFDIRRSEKAVFSYVGGLGNSGSNMCSVMKETFRHRLSLYKQHLNSMSTSDWSGEIWMALDIEVLRADEGEVNTKVGNEFCKRKVQFFSKQYVNLYNSAPRMQGRRCILKQAFLCSGSVKYENAFSGRQQPMAIDKLLLGACGIEDYRVLVFFREKSLALDISIYSFESDCHNHDVDGNLAHLANAVRSVKGNAYNGPILTRSKWHVASTRNHLMAVHGKVITLETNLCKMSLPLAAYILTGTLIPSKVGDWGHGGVVVRLLASHQGEPGSISGGVAPRIFECGYRAGRCRWTAGFLGDLLVHLVSLFSVLETSFLTAAEICSLIALDVVGEGYACSIYASMQFNAMHAPGGGEKVSWEWRRNLHSRLRLTFLKPCSISAFMIFFRLMQTKPENRTKRTTHHIQADLVARHSSTRNWPAGNFVSSSPLSQASLLPRCDVPHHDRLLSLSVASLPLPLFASAGARACYTLFTVKSAQYSVTTETLHALRVGAMRR
ncbi:hypothetical protein PR048_031067 [Dryococelus australis]|uniref:Uncharacterized protein n=1 Tax=Dryococelus australis TaxID=614101 RepID=A0ABQ9G7C4_9NEOP|nr:hypothetical protein PR048_031067 [Dryococelus australis]